MMSVIFVLFLISYICAKECVKRILLVCILAVCFLFLIFCQINIVQAESVNHFLGFKWGRKNISCPSTCTSSNVLAGVLKLKNLKSYMG